MLDPNKSVAENLEEIRGLLQNTTPGPWWKRECGFGGALIMPPVTPDGRDRAIASTNRSEDAPFIAASPEVVAYLLRLVEEYKAKYIEDHLIVCRTIPLDRLAEVGKALDEEVSRRMREGQEEK